MEDIIKLIDITKRKGQRSIQLINQNFRKKEVSKDNLLYEGIIEGKFENDDVAAKKIFRTDPGNRNYRNAKRKLRQKLLNHLYFLDYDKDIYSNYDRCNYECLHQLHQCKILIAEGVHDVAIKLLPSLIKSAIENECADIAVESIVLLRNEYARMGKTTLYEETAKEYNNQKKFLEAIHECEELYFKTLVQINKSISAQLRILPKISKIIESISTKAHKFKSQRLDVLSHKLQLQYNQLNGDYAANIKLCSILEKKYLQQPHVEVNVDLDRKDISFQKLYSFFCIKDVKNGNDYAEKSVKQYKAGSLEWFNFVEYHFLLLLKEAEYKKAADIYRKVRTSKNYSLIKEEDKERWQIYRAFLVFYKDTKLLKWGFDLGQFLEYKPTFPKEQQGYNTATLIIQFMYLLREGKTENIQEIINELQKYNSVHLDKRHNYRTSIFIRLLEIVTDKEFSYDLVVEKGQNYLKKLETTQIPSDLHLDMEVIPYEILWKTITEELKNNKMYVHFRFYNPLQVSE